MTAIIGDLMVFRPRPNSCVTSRQIDQSMCSRVVMSSSKRHLLLLAMFRHGLRVSEAIAIRRDEVDLDRARLWVRRLKGGLSVEQPIAGDELRAFRRYLASREDALPWLFLSERGQPFTRQSVNYLVATAAARAGLASVHPRTLRHSCGFALANKGYDLRLIQDYLGHRDPRHTTPEQPDDVSKDCGAD
jgi:type 1 fimbriae regulatory protein FimB